MSDVINIKETLINTSLILDQDKKDFSIKYDLTIDEDDAVLNFTITNADKKETISEHLDWDDDVIPMLSKCIKGKCALTDLKQYKDYVNTLVAEKFLLDFLNGFVDTLEVFYNEVCKISNRTIAAKLNSGFTGAIKTIDIFVSQMNEYLEEDRKISLGA